MTVKLPQTPPVQVIVPVPDDASMVAISFGAGGRMPVPTPPDVLAHLPVVVVSQVPAPPTQNSVLVGTNERVTVDQAPDVIVLVLTVLAPAVAFNSSREFSSSF